MAITLDATISGTASNSYLSLPRANDLAETLPHMPDWQSQPGLNKPQLLVHATRLIDRYVDFYGEKTVKEQSLKWPRKMVYRHYSNADGWLLNWGFHPSDRELISETEIPDFIEWATIEWAYMLYLDGESMRINAPGLKRLKTPSYDVEFGGSGKRRVPLVVSELLLDYGEPIVQGNRLMRA